MPAQQGGPVKQRALQLMRAHCQVSLYQIGSRLAATGNHTAHELAAVLLGEHYAQAPAPAAALLRQLADSEHWEVREWAASGCGTALTRHFRSFHPVLREWTRSPSAPVRRAVAVAAKYAARTLPGSCAQVLLDLIEPLLKDEDRYVQKNLGPFAIGDGLLRRYPETVLARLECWADDPDESVRWNVAMVFTAAAAAPFDSHWQRIRPKLAGDPRRRVQGAIRAADQAILKRVHGGAVGEGKRGH